MTQEEKELLLRDLSARLPYGVKTIYKDIIMEIFVVSTFLDKMCCLKWDSHMGYYNQTHAHIGQFKPYLRPMSSMTEEELYEVQEILGKGVEIHDVFISIVDSSINTFSYLELQAVFDWLNSHHFDYRGLIEKGIALEAPNGMYK